MSSLTEREAARRITEACELIRSAYRLHTFDPKDTLLSVRTAISWGAEQQAQDTAEEASLGRRAL